MNKYSVTMRSERVTDSDTVYEVEAFTAADAITQANLRHGRGTPKWHAVDVEPIEVAEKNVFTAEEGIKLNY